MQIVKIISTLFAVIVLNASFGQLSFYKNYSDEGYDYGEGVVQLEDSSYVITGASSSFTSGPSQAYLLKVDSAGNYKWSNSYGGFESESGRRVLYKKNFGFFMAGYTNSMGNGSFDYYLVKTDENGTKEWERTYGGSGWERVYDAALTKDTGVIMVGMTKSSINGNEDWLIVRTDKDGDTLWTRTIGTPGSEFGRTIEQYNDSMFVLGGSLFALDSMKTRGLILYMDDSGTIWDRDTLGVTGNYDIYDFTISQDTLHGVGSFQMEDTSQTSMVLYSMHMFDDHISPFGFFTVSINGDHIAREITTYGDLSSRYMAYTYEGDGVAFPYGTDVKIARYSWLLAWLNTAAVVAEEQTDMVNDLIPTSDGGAIAVGYREGIGIGGSTIWLLKIGPDETIPVIGGVTFVNQLVEIPETDPVFSTFKLYPNPASYAFTVEVPEEHNYEAGVYDITGKMILTATISGKQVIDVNGLAPGVYNFQLAKDGNRLLTKRIVIH